MTVRSLVDIALAACIKHVSIISDLGDLPSHLAHPILLKVENPVQLRNIEIASPHLAEVSVDAWKRLIARDFSGWDKKNYVPKNPLSWYRVYQRYKREEDAEIAEAEAKLMNAFSAIQAEKDSKKSEIVAARLMPKLPRDGRLVGSRVDRGRDVPDHLSWGGGSRTKTTNPLQKAKREAREIAARKNLVTPTGQLTVPRGQIARAPEAMVNQYRVQKQEPLRVRPPRKAKTDVQLAEELERKEREARLLKIKGMSSNRPAQVLSDTEDDGDDDAGRNHLKDLFDDYEDDNDDDEDALPPLSSTSKKPAGPFYHSEPSSATQKRSGLPPNKRKPLGGLLSNAFKPGSQKRAVPHAPSKSPADSPRRQPQSSPPLRPRQSSPQAPPPSLRGQLGQSSPPLNPQPRPAGSPPPTMSLKRKPPPDIFMRKKRKI